MSRASAIEMAMSGLRQLIEAPDPNQWVSQHDSPLGRRRHCRLVRSGKLPGYKVSGLVLVRRGVLDSYIEEHPVQPTTPRQTPIEVEDDEVTQAIRKAHHAPARKRRKAA